MRNYRLPAGLSNGIDNAPTIHWTARYPATSGWTSYNEGRKSPWLSDHPLLESRLISVKPLFHVHWVIERRYVSANPAGYKIDPTCKQWASKDLQVEKAVGGVLDNPMGITVDDVLRALIAR